MTLEQLGWGGREAAIFGERFADAGLAPARVVRTSKHVYHVVSGSGRHVARVSGGFRHLAESQAEYPAVGDWVAIKPRGDSGEMNIHGMLERRSSISRQSITGSGRGRRIEEQVLAADVDVAFLVAALDGERGFNLRRLERYLTLARDGGVEPVVILNKADLCENIADVLAETEAIAAGAAVHVASAESGEGIELLEKHIAPGRTLVLLGPSGVGKSSLINRLFGEEILATGAVRDSDARGKHTTTWSEIRVLPGGGVLIDTPGMREVLLWSDAESVDATFAEIRELASACKFSDCGHGEEPGCAVRAAVESRQLDQARFDSYLKLREEVARTREQIELSAGKREGTRAVRVRREKRRRWKRR